MTGAENSPHSLAEPALRQAIDEALARSGELLVVIRRTNAGGLREWWLVNDPQALSAILERPSVAWGRSDAVEVYVADGFVHCERDPDALRRKAHEIVSQTDVVMGYRVSDNSELDVVETDDPSEIDEWFAEENRYERFVLPHPLLTRNDFFPAAQDAFLAYAPLPDGSVVPGAY